MPDAWSVTEAVASLYPPMTRRELARQLSRAGVPPVGTLYGRKGRRARTYPVRRIFEVHADWVRENGRVGTSTVTT